MISLMDRIDTFYRGDHLGAKLFGSGALGSAAVSAVCEVTTGMSSDTYSAIGVTGAMVILAVVTEVNEALTRNRDQQQSDLLHE